MEHVQMCAGGDLMEKTLTEAAQLLEKDREPEAAADAEAHMKAEFEATLQAEREEVARKQEELQAQLQAQQAALKENKSVAASCPQASKRLRYECSF
jgi:ABC-type phosphate transport system auxiliary subunit